MIVFDTIFSDNNRRPAGLQTQFSQPVSKRCLNKPNASSEQPPRPLVKLLRVGSKPDEKIFVNAYVEFLRKIRHDAPRAKIFLADSPMLYDPPGKAPKRSVLRAYLLETIEKLGDAEVRAAPVRSAVIIFKSARGRVSPSFKRWSFLKTS